MGEIYHSNLKVDDDSDEQNPFLILRKSIAALTLRSDKTKPSTLTKQQTQQILHRYDGEGLSEGGTGSNDHLITPKTINCNRPSQSRTWYSQRKNSEVQRDRKSEQQHHPTPTPTPSPSNHHQISFPLPATTYSNFSKDSDQHDDNFDSYYKQPVTIHPISSHKFYPNQSPLLSTGKFNPTKPQDSISPSRPTPSKRTTTNPTKVYYHQSSQSIIYPTTPTSSSSSESKPQKSKKLASPSSSLLPSESRRCDATNLNGSPCSRRPIGHQNNLTSIDRLDIILRTSDSIDGLENLPRYCGTHLRKIDSQAEIFMGRGGTLIKFDDYISKDLPQTVRVNLKNEMIRRPTQRDSLSTGYIYCYELITKKNPSSSSEGQDNDDEIQIITREEYLARSPRGSSGTSQLKIGRSKNPVIRHSQWSSQCPSKSPIIRGIFPDGTSEEDGSDNRRVYLKGTIGISEPGIRFHERWEKFCLIELAAWSDLQKSNRSNCQPSSDSPRPQHTPRRNVMVHDDDDETIKSPKSRKVKDGQTGKGRKESVGEACKDCGKVHCEIFEFDQGSYERLVRPTILKWEKWCRFAYD